MADELFGRRLVNQISPFEELQYFKEVVDVAPHIQKRQGNHLEQYLQTLSEDSKKGDRTKLRQLVAIRFYLKHLLLHCAREWKRFAVDSNYRTLINDVRPIQEASSERVILVTFNYDTLLEDGLQLALPSVRIQSISDYVSSEWPIFKLHGSANWGRVISTYMPDVIKMEQQLDRERAIISKSPLDISGTYVFDSGGSGLGTATEIPAGARLLFPALAIPMLNKDEFELPRDHVEMLKQMLPSVSKVVAIGWRGTEDKFLGMLKEGLQPKTEIMAVSRNKASADAVIRSFGKAGVPMTRNELANGGFTSSLDQIVEFVRQPENQ